MKRPPPTPRQAPTRETGAAGFAEDLALVRATLQGDPRAIDVFVERLRCVARYLHSRNRRFGSVLDEHELCDLVQDVMTLLWLQRARYQGLGPLEGWACGTALLQFMNRIRRTRRASDVERGGQLEDPRAEDPDVLDPIPVREALACLPERERSVIHAKHFDDQSFTEIGAAFDMPPSTAKTCYYRGLR